MFDLEIDTELLITLVKNKPVLWDKTIEIYKDRNATKMAWDEVYTFLNKDFPKLGKNEQNVFTKEVLKRWTNVRDSFAKFCKKERQVMKTGARYSNRKKYVYHNQLRFLDKLYNSEDAEENYENERAENASPNDTETFISTVYPQIPSNDFETLSDAGGEGNLTSAGTPSTASRLPNSILNKRKRFYASELTTSLKNNRTRNQNTETQLDAVGEDNLTSAETISTSSRLSSSILNKRKKTGVSKLRTLLKDPRPQSQDIETLSDAGGEDNLTSSETASTSSRVSSSIFNKGKRSDESEHRNSKVLDGEKYNRHLSFFKGIVPSLEEFNEQEILKFQMGVLQLISNISDQRHGASPHISVPSQFLSFPSQPGPSAMPFSNTMYLPSMATPYPSGQPVFPFWSSVCPKCTSEPTHRESTSKPVD